VTIKARVTACLVCLLIAAGHDASTGVGAQTSADGTPSRDGRRDFEEQIGEWTTKLKRLQRPLSGSTTWLEYEGTTRVIPVLGGRANLAELDVKGPAGRIEGAALRLYEPQSGRWTINYFNAADGTLTAPLQGMFRGGRGVFEGKDTFGVRPISVRFVISRLGADSYHFEQAFSGDGGKTWEVNWIATDTRRPGPPQAASNLPQAYTPDQLREPLIRAHRIQSRLAVHVHDHDAACVDHRFQDLKGAVHFAELRERAGGIEGWRGSAIGQ
jgi:hypothetical protein